MSTSSNKMLVSVGERCACVKIAGRANFSSGVDLKTLLDELLQTGRTYFVLDLTECVLMDSTFLGVLAGFGMKVNGPQPDKVNRTLELYNPNPRVAELLESLGILNLFKIVVGNLNLPEETAPHDHSPCIPTREQVTENCLEAHRTLMSLNPDNISRFKDVTAFLAEDLKKMKAATAD